jgi:hypothetical protein
MERMYSPFDLRGNAAILVNDRLSILPPGKKFPHFGDISGRARIAAFPPFRSDRARKARAAASLRRPAATFRLKPGNALPFLQLAAWHSASGGGGEAAFWRLTQ